MFEPDTMVEYTEGISEGILTVKGGGMPKKLRLGATVIVALSSVVLFGDTAFASSIYDENYTTINSVHLGNTAWPGSGGACEAVDYTNDWANAMTTALTNGENSNNGASAAYLASWQEAQENGRWGVSQGYFRFNPSDLTQRTYDYILVYWTEDTSLGLNWTSSPDSVATTGNSVHVAAIYTKAAWVYGSSTCTPYAVVGIENSIVSTEADGNGDGYHITNNLFVYSDHLNLPNGYEGEQIVTSDPSGDTDGDGLSNYVESLSYPNRQDIFCGMECAYPDPTTKDVYVEIDWMKDSSNNNIYKPSATQLGLVEAMFDAKGINFHADTGQFGGGNELPSYEHTLPFAQDSNDFDFYDYKNETASTDANFDGARKRIWHYMVSGYQYAENIGSSGVSFAGDDDLFISYGLIQGSQSSFGYLSLDQAIAGTIAHELGHNLCLSNATYSGQSSNCIYDGIDNTSASSSYVSSMNYSYQMFMVDYSNGVNGTPNDHNDWYAVGIGMKDFSNADRDAGDVANGKSKTKKLIPGISIQQAKDLRRGNELGLRNNNYFTRQFQMPIR